MQVHSSIKHSLLLLAIILMVVPTHNIPAAVPLLIQTGTAESPVDEPIEHSTTGVCEGRCTAGRQYATDQDGRGYRVASNLPAGHATVCHSTVTCFPLLHVLFCVWRE